MEKIYIGKITSTHGIKGELKIKSNFEFKDKVFKVGNKLLIDNKLYEIKSYRVHKGFDMVTLDDYNDINQVLFLRGKNVYFSKDMLNLDNEEILDEDLIKYSIVLNDGKCGIIEEVFYASSSNKIIRINIDGETHLIPFNSPCILSIDKENKCIKIELIDGM